MFTTKKLTRLTTCCALLFGGITAALAATQLRISAAAPPVSPLVSAFEIIKEQVESAHPNEIQVSIHHSSSLFKQGTELPAMQRGNLEMATPITFEIEQQMPEYSVFSRPYLFRDLDHMQSVFRGEIGQQFRDDVYKKLGIVILDTGYLGTRVIGLRNTRHVEKPEDLKGVKMRMPPSPAFKNLAQALGTTPISMPVTEVYLALKTGSIDAQENPLNVARDWKFDEMTTEFVLTNHLVQPIFFAVSGKAWEALSSEQRSTLETATRAAVDEQIRLTVQEENEALEAMKKAGTLITQPDLNAFRDAVSTIYDQSGMQKDWKPGLYEQIINLP